MNRFLKGGNVNKIVLLTLIILIFISCASNKMQTQDNEDHHTNPPVIPKAEIHKMLLEGRIRIVENGFDSSSSCEHMLERYQVTVNQGIKDVLENDLDGHLFNERVFTAWRLGCEICGVNLVPNHERTDYCEHVWNRIEDTLRHGVAQKLSVEELAVKSLEIKQTGCVECK